MDGGQGSQMDDSQEVLRMLLSQAREEIVELEFLDNGGTSVRVINEYFFTVCTLLSLAGNLGYL